MPSTVKSLAGSIEFPKVRNEESDRIRFHKSSQHTRRHMKIVLNFNPIMLHCIEFQISDSFNTFLYEFFCVNTFIVVSQSRR